MVTPLQPVTEQRDFLQKGHYEAIDNELLQYDKDTRFPLMHLINGYAEEGERIRVITLTPDSNSSRIHLEQLREEVAELQTEKGFLCDGVESVNLTYAGDVGTQLELFRKLLPYFEKDDTIYACLTFGVKPMPIAELMAVEYAYRVIDGTSIGCLIYGELDHSVDPPRMRVFDITSLIRLDEIVRMLAEQRIADPMSIINNVLSFGEE